MSGERPPETPPKLLLSGAPGTGKTTLLAQLARELGDKATGFYTVEIRQSGRRRGFELVSLTSSLRTTLASVDYSSSYRVSRYGVRPETLDPFLEELEEALNSGDPKCIILDEIGKMELFSDQFRKTVLQVMEAPLPVVATIMAKPEPFCDKLKKRPETTRWELTVENREQVYYRIRSTVFDYLGLPLTQP